MSEALLEIDAGLEEGRYGILSDGTAGLGEEEDGLADEMAAAEHRPERGGRFDRPIPLAEAWDMQTEQAALGDSVGRRTGEFIHLYPPGVPLLAPGEQMTAGLCRLIQKSLAQGLNVQGIEIQEGTDRIEDRAFVQVIREAGVEKS